MTADERIKKLLDRAGYHPVRFKNTVENGEEHTQRLRDVINSEYQGDPLNMINVLVETVNDLENALESVLA